MNLDQRALGESTIRVLVADNSRIHTRLLADALTRDAALEVVPFESEASALVAVAMQKHIDVLVVSSNLDEQPCRGVEVVRELRVADPRIRAVLLLDSSKDDAVLDAFRAGARGIFGRDQPMELLSKCVSCAYRGQIWADNRQLALAVEALANTPTVRAANANGMSLLSERELQVVRCLAEGLTNREIAQRLKLSQHTVKNYFFKIFDKLGVSSRVELLFMSLSQAAVDPGAISERDGFGTPKYSPAESEALMKSAQAGMPAAQLALAQMYLARRAEPREVIEGYKWYLIATECAMQSRGFISKMLTVEQIEEAKREATIWLAKRKQTAPLSEGTAPPPKQAASSSPAPRFARATGAPRG
jgi:two-component system, NarL family, nitrate/nitrite response regulator NarL